MISSGRLQGTSFALFRGRTVVLCGLLLCVASQACQVPVFRYALERWEPAPYLLSVTPGPSGLTEAEKGVVEALEHSKTLANLKVEIKPAAEKAALVLHDPRLRAADDAAPVWRGDLSMAHALMLRDSPVRDELRKRLLSGQTAVWLLLESGDATKDDAAQTTLHASMKLVEQRVKLPDGVITQEEAGQPDARRRHENADVLQTDLPLKMEFSILRLNRKDEREAALVAMLMHLEPDLGEFAGEPMVFPVFGRGRALEPLIGKGIHDDNILQTATYLCGACSCEIKDQNPGMDLLIAADWSAVDNTPVVETVRIEPRPAVATSPSPIPSSTRLRWVAVAAALLLLLGLAIRKPRSS